MTMAAIALSSAFLAGMAIGWAVLPVVIGGGIILWIGGHRAHAGWLVALALAVALGVWRAGAMRDPVALPWSDAATAVRGRVVSGPLDTGQDQRFELEITGVRARGWLPARGKLCASAPLVPRVSFGDTLTATGTTELAGEMRPSFGRYLLARGCLASLKAAGIARDAEGQGVRVSLDRLRRKLTDVLHAAAPGDTGALLAGLVTGDDQALSEERRDAFVTTGTTHITAVSGSNVALLVVCLTAFGMAAGWRRTVAWTALTTAVIWGYALMVGLGPPTLRAALVATGALAAVLFGRRPDMVTLIAISAALEAAWRPDDVSLLAFRLSVCSALALVLAMAGMERSGHFWWLSSALKGTAAAQVATLPILVRSFGVVSPVALPANLFILPVVAVAFPLAFLAALAGVVSEPLGMALAFPASLGARWIIAVVDHANDLPGALVTVGAGDPGVTLLTTGLALVAIALMSAECRRASVRAWNHVRAQPATMVVAVSAVAGALSGVLAMMVSR